MYSLRRSLPGLPPCLAESHDCLLQGRVELDVEQSMVMHQHRGVVECRCHTITALQQQKSGLRSRTTQSQCADLGGSSSLVWQELVPLHAVGNTGAFVATYQKGGATENLASIPLRRKRALSVRLIRSGKGMDRNTALERSLGLGVTHHTFLGVIRGLRRLKLRV